MQEKLIADNKFYTYTSTYVYFVYVDRYIQSTIS